LDGHDVQADIRCDRWNPISKSWTSHENLMNAERRKSAGTGRTAWQVRVGPSAHRELKTLARHLEAASDGNRQRSRTLQAEDQASNRRPGRRERFGANVGGGF
jgi:hypothetical protein